MTRHEFSTFAWLIVVLVGAGVMIGFWLGVRAGPSYHDAQQVEQRLREVFCEQAIKNGVLTTCQAFKGE